MSQIKNELILCTQTSNDIVDYRTFGNTIINQCQIDLKVFSRENKYPTYFYQMYLRKPKNGLFEDNPIPIKGPKAKPKI